MSKEIIAICASTLPKNGGVIGNNNKLPWHIPEDLTHFKKETLNSTIIMGRKTYNSIGKPLPKRQNIILTRNKEFILDHQNTRVCHSRDEALRSAHNERIFIIGGEEIFYLFNGLIDSWIITWINKSYEGNVKINWEKMLNGFLEVNTKTYETFTISKYRRT